MAPLLVSGTFNQQVHISSTNRNAKTRVDRELRIRGYIRRGVIDEGSFAKVWRGTFVYNQTIPLAIKVINKKTADSELITKFLPREMESLRQIRHPYFIKLYDIFEASSCVFIVMELANDSLANVIDMYGGMSETYVRRIFRQICTVVKYLHNKNICHRDLKCENILLDSLGNVKLTDLGFSRQCRRIHGQPMLCATYCGSLGYSSPEVLRGQPYDPKLSDIWSLGCILFMIATGYLPFDESNANIMLKKQLSRKFCPMSNKVLRHLDPELVSFVYNILDPNPPSRLSLVEILSHPWMTKVDNKNCPECPLKDLVPSLYDEDLEEHVDMDSTMPHHTEVGAEPRQVATTETFNDGDCRPASDVLIKDDEKIVNNNNNTRSMFQMEADSSLLFSRN